MKPFTTACPDWERRIVAGESLIPFVPLFPKEAAAALEVFNSLQITDLPQVYDRKTGKYRHPTFGESCEQYVFDFVAAIFGSYDAETGRRWIEEAMLLIAKKNIKSTVAAGIMVTALVLNWRNHQELVILSPTREVSDNSFKPAAAMVRADEDLDALMHVQDNLKQITHRTTKAVLKVVSADANTAAGKKAGFLLVEELWLFGKRPNSSAMLQEAAGGLIARPEGFVIYITTQSDEIPTGVFKEKLDYFRDVRDGKIDDQHSLPVLYEFPDGMIKSKAYLDPENWYITNPNMGRSVRQDWLERKLAKVQAGDDEEGDSYQSFLAKHLNVEIGMGLRGNRWPGANYWDQAEDEELAALDHFAALDRLLDRSEVVVCGTDGGGLDDLFGFTVVGREPAEIAVPVMVNGAHTTVWMKRWLSWSHAWCHRDVLRRRKKIAPMLFDLEKSKRLTIIDTALEDLAAIVELLKKVKERGLLAAVAADPAGLGEFIDALAVPEVDITEENGLLIGIPQGFALMNAIKTSERRLSNGLLRHSGGPLMRWCVQNLKIEPTATAIRATKQTAGDAKIDPVMALFDAVTVMVKNPEAAQVSGWETHDLDALEAKIEAEAARADALTHIY